MTAEGTAAKPKMTLRWYIESGRSSPGEVCLEYEFVSEDGVARRSGGANLMGEHKAPKWHPPDLPYPWAHPAITEESVLARLTKQLEDEGYDVTVERGHYRRVWVPDDVDNP